MVKCYNTRSPLRFFYTLTFKIELPRYFALISNRSQKEIARISIIEIRRVAIDALQKLAILNLTGVWSVIRKFFDENATYRPSLTVDLRSNYWIQWGSNSEKWWALTTTDPSYFPLAEEEKEKGGKRRGGNGARVRMAIRWNKRPEASEVGSCIICSGALFDGAELRSFARLRGDSGKMSAQSTISARRDDNADLVSHLNEKQRHMPNFVYRALLLSRARSLDCHGRSTR